VVLARQPEDRHGVEARLRRFPRPGNRRRRLQQGVERAAEERDLLPGHNCRCPMAQSIDIARGEFAASEGRVLRGQQIR
jgi:hypothetical protein